MTDQYQVVFKDYLTYIVLEKEVNIISDDLQTGRNTISEINETYHYFGNEQPNVGTAIIAMENYIGRDLTYDELKQALQDNKLLSQGI
jgi:hypothetical protein